MAKNSIRDYDATSGNNTDVQSVDISEGCAASGINNAIREVMADLKDVSTGAVNLETPAADRLDVDNIRIDGNTISSTDTNGDITLDPNGSGDVVVAQVASSSLDIEGDRTDAQITLKGGSAGAGIQLFGSTYTNYAGAMYLDATASTTGTNDAQMVFRTGSSPSEAMRIDRSGNVLVGCTATTGVGNGTNEGVVLSSSQKQIVVGIDADVALILNRQSSDGTVQQFRKDGTTRGSVSVSSSGTTYNTTSDRRLKTDIQPIADATDKLMQMQPVTHKWIAEPDGDAVHGFIAQDMQQVCPEAVSGEDGGEEMMSMDYGRITPVLVAALQDAHRKIEELEQRLSEMEN